MSTYYEFYAAVKRDDKIKAIIFALNELRNQLMQEGRYTDAVDELLI